MGKADFSRAPEPRRFLVVEDQESLFTVIAEGLAPSFEVLCAATVADGVELLLAAAVDVVLLDCVLPGETMWQIVLEADRQQVPVCSHDRRSRADEGGAGGSTAPTFSSRLPWRI
jgi:DNA-binding response OmpR family regulator